MSKKIISKKYLYQPIDFQCRQAHTLIDNDGQSIQKNKERLKTSCFDDVVPPFM